MLINPSSTVSTDVATSDFVYIRWEGDRKKIKGTLGKVEADRTEELRMSAETVKTFLDHQLEVFGYFSKYYSGYPPADVEQLQNFLNIG